MANYEKEILSWWNSNRYKPFVITGAAGTGKTTLAKQIPAMVGCCNPGMLAPTGKAALQLGGNARTIHSFRYKLLTERKYGKIIKTFVPKTREECQEEYDMLIVDEASMVSDKMYQELLDLRIPIIAMGDPYQLPPIQGTSSMMKEPNIHLTEVHRNGGNILKLATHTRETGTVLYADVQTEDLDIITNGYIDSLIEHDGEIICQYNKTRQLINGYVRKHKFGFTGEVQLGERLICLKNTKVGIMNGTMLTVDEIELVSKSGIYAVVKFNNGWGEETYENVFLSSRIKEGKEPGRGWNTINPMSHEEYPVVYYDFGYAITCHKAQGSGFDSVAVVVEDTSPTWLYTAATRAKKKLKVFYNLNLLLKSEEQKKYNRVVTLDVETNGITVGEAVITEFGYAIQESGKIIESGSFYINQGDIEIPEHVQKLTGITPRKLKEQGVPIEEARKRIKDLWESADLVVAYNAVFDVNHILHFLGKSIDDEKDYLDPLLIVADNKRWSKTSGHKLTQACEYWGVTIGNAHEAEVDVLATVDLVKKFTGFIPVTQYINHFGHYAKYGIPEDKKIPKHVRLLPLSFKGDNAALIEINSKNTGGSL